MKTHSVTLLTRMSYRSCSSHKCRWHHGQALVGLSVYTGQQAQFTCEAFQMAGVRSMRGEFAGKLRLQCET